MLGMSGPDGVKPAMKTVPEDLVAIPESGEPNGHLD
jgi:hypothetical protein